jgi:hypothetical protein
MPMGRGARVTRTGGRTAVSIPLSNVRRRVQETAGFATATLGQEMVFNGEAGVEPLLLLHWHRYRPDACDEEQA